MTIPRYDDTLLHPLADDAAVLDRATALVGVAYRRQIWLMLVDDDEIQLPQLIPMDIPRRSRRRDLGGYAAFLAHLAQATGAASIVAVYERPGEPEYTEADRGWFRFLADAASGAGVRLRGPVLSHRTGVRWVASEDYAL